MGYPTFCYKVRVSVGEREYSKKMNFFNLQEAFQWLRDCHNLARKCNYAFFGFIYIGTSWFRVDVSNPDDGYATGIELMELQSEPEFPDGDPKCCCECK